MSRLHERIHSWSKVSDINTRKTLFETKEVIRLLEDALAGLRPGLSSTPEAGNTINNFFGSGVPQPDDQFYWFTPGDLQAANTTRSSGITWRTIGVFPHRMEFHAKQTSRYYLSDYLRTAVGGSLDFSEAHYEFDETQSYAEDPAAATWRGLDVAGTVTIGTVAGTGGGGVDVILNGSLDSWSGSPAFTPYWALNTVPGGQVSPGEGGIGSAIYMERSAGNNGSFIANHVTGSGSAVSAPYNLNASATMAKDTTWVLSFDYLNATVDNKLGISILAQSTVTYNVPLNSSYAGLSLAVGPVGTLDGTSTQDFDITATQTWQTGIDQVISLTNVPADATYRTYTITFTTNGIAATVGFGSGNNTIYPRIYFSCAGTGGDHYLAIDNISILPVSNPTNINLQLTERALTLDQFTYAPTLSASGDTLSFDEVTGAWLVPTLAPATVAGSTVTMTHAYGAVTGFDLDATHMAASTISANDVVGLRMKLPEFGTTASNFLMDDASGGYFTAFRTGVQGYNIRYRLPLDTPFANGQVLSSDVDGLMSWVDASAIPNPPVTQPMAFQADDAEEGLWMLGVGAAVSSSIGPSGPQGPAGAPGPPGSDGEDGQDGVPGAVGPQGATGATGATGPPGLDGADGLDGLDGLPGPAGPQGVAGVAGPPGLDGEPGEDGAMGMPGPAGAAGATGATGFMGMPGLDGEDGIDGRPGLTGATGAIGAMGPPGWDGSDADCQCANGISSNQVRGAGGVTGSGTLNHVAKWTPDGFTLGDSVIVEGNGAISAIATSGVILGGASSFVLLDGVDGFQFVNGDTLFSVDVAGITTIGNGSAFDGSQLRLLEPAGSGAKYTAFKAQVQSADLIYTLPSTAPAANQVLTSSGGASSTLSWTTPTAAAAATAPCMNPDTADDAASWALMGIPSDARQPSSGVGGSGTANKVAKWATGSTLTNSMIWDDGTNVNIGQIASTTGKLAVIGAIATENPGAAFIIQPGGNITYSLTANGGLGGISRTESVPILAPTVNGAIKTCTTAGQQSWTSVLPIANGGTGSAMGPQPTGGIALDGESCDCGNFIPRPYPVFDISGADIGLPNGTIESELASSSSAFKLSTKNNLGVQTPRLQIQSGATNALTQVNFLNAGTTNFNNSSCTGLQGLTPNTGGLRDNGTLALPWGNVYSTNLVLGEDGDSSSGIIKVVDGGGTAVTVMTLTLGGTPLTITPATEFTANISKYKNVTTAGWGVPAVYAEARFTAQTAAKASVATYTVGAADGSFLVSANVLVTTATLHNFTVTCAYTDEGNTARTLTLNFQTIAGVVGTSIANTAGAVPYEGLPVHIRAKASTAITIATVGTFTTVTYNVEGSIVQIG